jgi:hypothetical protein
METNGHMLKMTLVVTLIITDDHERMENKSYLHLALVS